MKMWSRRKHRFLLLLLAVGVLYSGTIITTTPSSRRIPHFRPTLTGPSCLKDPGFLSLKNVIHPPPLDEDQFTQTLTILQGHISQNEDALASSHLSALVAKQFQDIQGTDCNLPHLQCGHEDNCGLGCQLQHRVACLMLSYATGLPLIHTLNPVGWPFNPEWTHAFLPLGSNCTPGNNTLVWKWTQSNSNPFPFPLAFGIPLDPKLGHLIETLTPDPWLWMVAQFVTFTTRYNPTLRDRLTKSGLEIGFDVTTTPIVGLHVRRTDKINEAPGSRHNISEYMTEAEVYFRAFETSRALEKGSVPRRVFVASDSSSVLPETIQMYPNWEVTGFATKFSEKVATREKGLFEIVRDIEFLSKTDFVVCGMSSNICRLIYEIQAVDSGRIKGVKSLDGSFLYQLYNPYSLHNATIWKIDC